MSASSAAFDHVIGYRWRQGDPDLADAEARLHDLGALRPALEQVITQAVIDARAEGVTWKRIGDALGVTHVAVIKRYGPVVRGGGQR